MTVYTLLASPAGSAAPSSQGNSDTGQEHQHLLWRVTSQQGSTAYVLGSMHMGTKDLSLDNCVRRIFQESKVLVTEVDMDKLLNPLTALSMLGRMMLPEGKTLDQVISPVTYAELTRYAQGLGLSMENLRKMKPWAVCTTLGTTKLKQSGFSEKDGIDYQVLLAAKEMQKTHKGLEAINDQIDILDRMSPAEQEKMLQEGLKELDSGVVQMAAMVQAWKSGDVSVFEKKALPSLQKNPETYRRLIVERNQNWVRPVEECLQKNEDCFIVVGATHLVGADGLPELLRKKGYTVERQ